MEDTVGFLPRKVIMRKLLSQIEISSLKKQKHEFLIHALLDNPFKGTVVNRTLPSLHGGSFEITLTVPLNLSQGV